MFDELLDDRGWRHAQGERGGDQGARRRPDDQAELPGDRRALEVVLDVGEEVCAL